MLQVEDAQQRIRAALRPLGTETVRLADAAGRVLAERVVAPMDLPAFDNSAMDGYALRAADVAGARPETAVRLALVGRSAAGEVFRGQVESGRCVRVFTGSILPEGADAVVMQEDTAVDASDPAVVLVHDAVKPWENVRFRGEDVKRGAVVSEPGARLGAGRLSLLGAFGIGEVSVGRRPRVALLATGSELREAGQPLGPGQIYESNRVGLAALVRRHGGVPIAYPLVPDDLGATQAALECALTECDLVVSTGGASVGELDLVKAAFEQLGGQIDLWRVAIKPGKPFAFGRWREKFLFGLPGNPVSALVCFCVFVVPALGALQGALEVELPASLGVLAEPLANRGDRRHFIRVKLSADGAVKSAGTQASHILSAVAEADGLVDVPSRTTLEAGRSVRVLRWE